MYLKSIEVQGFKSFANKLLFEFHDGITAIVGPNGSGKSNVADAVRWVLGEQSAKQLRGAKMEDVIFSGTEMRKPLGYAYVAITLDNSDHKLATPYEEVKVGRRVYRSGESEYLINGAVCRLKDVQELFLDTGIGKEGYSIIGQGQIDKILSGKPEDRRELFDEAAGIVKYKKRKTETWKNLEQERQNLCRVQDILREIETQIVPLEKQSKTAKEYLQFRDQLKVYEVNLFLEEYEKDAQSLKELEQRIQIVTDDLEETGRVYDSTKEEYVKLEQLLEEQADSLELNRNEYNQKQLNKEQLEGNIKVIKEQITSAKQSSAQYKERIEQAEQSAEEKQKRKTVYEEQLLEEKEQLEKAKEACKIEEEQYQALIEEIALTEKQVEQFNEEIRDALNENTGLKTSLERYETMLEQNNIKRAEMNQKILRNKSREAELEQSIQEEQKKCNILSERIQILLSNNTEFQKKVKEMNDAMADSEKQLRQMQQNYHRETSKLDSLKNMTERYEGYGQSIRRVMEQRKHTPGILGVVADIVKVKEDYETAIETALGGSIQNVVTDNEETAKELIAFLKKNRYGRATFLPLTAIHTRGHAFQPEVLKEQGVIGIASSLVSTEARFQELVENLLGRILVVRHIDDAIRLSRKYRQSLRIVTLEGDLVNPGGSMSGGAFKNSSTLLSRHREMETMEKEIEQIKKKISALEQNISEYTRKRHDWREQIEQNKDKLQKLYLEQNTVKLTLEQEKTAKEDNERKIQQTVLDLKLIEKEILQLKENIQKSNTSLEEQKELNSSKEQEIASLNAQIEKKKQAADIHREKAEQYRLQLAQQEQSCRFIQENMQRIQEEMEQLRQSCVILKQELQNSQAEALEREEETKRIYACIETLKSDMISIESTIEELQKEKRKIEQSHKAFLEKREELSERKNNLDKESYRLQTQQEKLKEQSESRLNYMWEEYELTYHNAAGMRTELDMEYPQLKKAIGELKNRIRALGPVNVNAIEDYKNMEERYRLLSTQHDDLVKSEAVLVDIIAELEEEMRKQFSEKFQEIKEQFDKVFKQMFGGGKGTLELMEDEDILEAGIKIIAQPPGKKLQNMMQLSGGEKALTAISILFAIQNLKPSPFCLLDEIEAALDDSNVSRYAKYLHRLTKHTQFIVITHRRGTMAAADRLYGITMQEKGVSTLVSVNLLEDELDD